MRALRGLAFGFLGLASGGACGLGVAAVLVSLLDRGGMINHGADGLSGVVLFFGLGAAMALGGGIVAAILVAQRARSAGTGSALLWVGAMLTVAVACYLLLTGLLTSVAGVETIGGA